jgi:folate-binding protein YgfZ
MPSATLPELDAQYRQLREEAGLLERAGRGVIGVSGPDAAEYLQGQLTNDIEALEAGTGCRAELLDRKGHIQADLRVVRPKAEEIVLVTEAASTAAAVRHLTMYSIGRDVSVTDRTEETAVLSVIGPRTEEVTGIAPLERFAVDEAKIDGTDLLAVGTRDGIDLLLPAAALDGVREELLGRGAAEVSEAAAEILRVESGDPRFGTDMGTETMPAEAGIVEETVSFTKGCYIGQETVARLHYRGRPNRHLRGLRLNGAAAAGDEVRHGERVVGTLGTVCLSPAHGRIALAILRREAEPGETVAVGDVTGEVVELPFAKESE